MEIPLKLISRKDGSLYYGIPLYFRLMIGGMLALIAAAIVMEDFHTGPVGWIVVILLILGVIYKEDWLFDAPNRLIHGLVGFYPLFKRTDLSFEEVSYIQLAAFSRGTIPGSAEEKSSNQEAFDEMKGDTPKKGVKGMEFFQRKKLYIAMLLITKNDEHYLLDMVPARKASRLSSTGRALAALIGCSFLENLSE